MKKGDLVVRASLPDYVMPKPECLGEIGLIVETSNSPFVMTEYFHNGIYCNTLTFTTTPPVISEINYAIHPSKKAIRIQTARDIAWCDSRYWEKVK